MSTSFTEEPDFRNTSTGVQLPQFLPEPKTLSSKKTRERRSLNYIPPAPRPHYVRSVPAQARLLHSRNDSRDLDSSFHYLMNNSNANHSGSIGVSSSGNSSILRQCFDIQERLGQGSFGDVYRVKSKLDNKEYAVKKSRRTYSGEGDRSRQLKEVQRVVNIPANDHLVILERAWEEEGYLYLQMELLAKSLTLDCEDEHYMTEDESWDLFIDMLLALQHLHTHHLVHMDVKPDNIFLTIDTPTIFKLGDFGIVVCLEEKKDVVEFTEGDSRYLAPEVMQGMVSTKADIFSLGLTLLEVACAVDLPKGGELWHSLRSGVLPDPCPRKMPKSLSKIIQWMLSPDVNKRPEVHDLMAIPAVKAHMRRRRRRLRMASILKKLSAVTRMWHALLSFLTSLMFFIPFKKVDRNDRMEVDDQSPRATPEPFFMEKDIPNIVLNDHSFSDDEMREGGTSPVFASTPIPQTKSGGRLRSSKRGTAQLDGELRVMGSPTSRNLLKDFDAVSD